MSQDPQIDLALRDGVKDGVFPGAVLLAALGDSVLYHQAQGWACLRPERSAMSKATVFDLASLTKPLATTLAVMRLISHGTLHLDQSLQDLGAPFNYPGKEGITIRQCLDHSAGFPAYQPFYLELEKAGKADRKTLLRHLVRKEPLLAVPGKETLYSDLGFIYLEWIVEHLAGTGLDSLVEGDLYKPLGLVETGFRPLRSSGPDQPETYAATEDCPWRKRILRGEVHDENAFAVGGVSGQAGLFGTAQEIFSLLREMKKAFDRPEMNGFFDGPLVRKFWERQQHPKGTSRALGFDTPAREDSSTGRYFSPKSVGHLGFTGTSFWIDPEKDLIVILLTNRVHPSRSNEKLKTFRPYLHDTVVRSFSPRFS
jgi:CubicO group peptidase (beta-lactamase class C family)